MCTETIAGQRHLCEVKILSSPCPLGEEVEAGQVISVEWSVGWGWSQELFGLSSLLLRRTGGANWDRTLTV